MMTAAIVTETLAAAAEIAAAEIAGPPERGSDDARRLRPVGYVRW